MLPSSLFTDATNRRQRVKPTNEGKCSSISRFVFDWDIDSLSHTQGFFLTSALFRPYMQVIARRFQVEGPVKVDFSVTLRQFENNSLNSTLQSTQRHLKSLNVTTESDGWLELDITDALREIWPPREDIPLEITLKLQVNCQVQKKVPVTFINPAEIPLAQTMRRERHLELQPLFVVSVNDHQIKAKIESEKRKLAAQLNGSTIELTEDTSKRKRSAKSTTVAAAYPYTCKLENFTVNFADLRLNHIISPTQINIQRCSGGCAHSNIKFNKTIASNHAKLMASARERYQQPNNNLPPNATLYMSEPGVPSCVPTSYESVYLMLQHPNRLQLSVFSHFVVTGCGCR